MTTEVDNLIHCEFSEEFYSAVFNMIKFQGGHVKTEKRLVDEFKLHPSVAKAVVKKMLRERGW